MTRLVPPLGPKDHLRGNPRAGTSLVEYGDYQCPYCGRAHFIVKKLLQVMSDQVRFAYRHFPLTQAHPRALRAAEAAEAAGSQGQFWPMYDLLFENQDALEEDDLIRYAGVIGLDVKAFADDLARHRDVDRIKRDFVSGARSGVNGTPTFFIDGFRFDGSWDLDSLVAALEAASRRRAQPMLSY